MKRSLESIEAGSFPRGLSDIIFVEGNASRAQRLAHMLAAQLPNGFVAVNTNEKPQYSELLKNAGFNSAAKPHIFVAMPFAKEMDDVFHYGIQGASNIAGYLCERADLSSFTGDVLDWVKSRIASAELVVGDLSNANPNVYFESATPGDVRFLPSSSSGIQTN